LKKFNILVVDDDRDFAESLADALELVGHEVSLAFTGEDAVKLFEGNDYDITFMDIKLPGKSGVESFFEMRRIKPNARVIMMTGYSVPQLLEQAVENGAWDVLHKPLEMQKVLKMVDKIKPYGVLIADDDPDFVESIKVTLENEGYVIHDAKDGEEALEILKKKKVDVLMLDLRMPVMNGLDTYMKMRESGKCVPTIIVTAYRSEEPETISALESLSVYGILSKPFDAKSLFSALDEICKTRSDNTECVDGE
jgi:DNA-binding response OmpR family regulator